MQHYSKGTHAVALLLKLESESAAETARILNKRQIATPTGAQWSAKTVIRVQQRVAA